MESFPDFNKLWGHIWNQQIIAGRNYTLIVYNDFDVSGFDGAKYIYFSEVNALGGTSTFLGLAFIIMSGVLFLIMFVFTVVYCARIAGKDLYSTQHLEW